MHICACMHAQLLSRVRLFVTLWAVASQAPLFMGFSMGCLAFFQGIFLMWGSNLGLLCLLHWQVGSLSLALPGKPRTPVNNILRQLYFNFPKKSILRWEAQDGKWDPRPLEVVSIASSSTSSFCIPSHAFPLCSNLNTLLPVPHTFHCCVWHFHFPLPRLPFHQPNLTHPTDQHHYRFL